MSYRSGCGAVRQARTVRDGEVVRSNRITPTNKNTPGDTVYFYATINTMKQPRRGTRIVNIFGTLGYLSVIFQWLWSAIILAYPLLSSDWSAVLPKPSNPITPDPVISTPSPLVVGIVIALTVVIFAATLYVIWKLPAAAGRSGGKATHRAADKLVPVLTGKVKLPQKKRLKLSYKIALLIKLSLILIPLMALCFASDITNLPIAVAWSAAAFCASLSIIYFGISMILVHLLKVRTEDVW